MKDIKDYDVEDVCIWLTCIGKIADKVDGFRENAVDGPMLLTLTEEDLKGDLGFSGLSCKKFFTKLEFTKELIASSGEGGSDDDGAAAAQLAALEGENAALKAELAELRSVQAAMAAPPPPPPRAPAPAPPPPPQQHHHHHHQQGPGVVGGAAVGAAGGAMKGAIAGAILPGMSASDGAKAGAAVGATTGGLRGLRNRRRRF